MAIAKELVPPVFGLLNSVAVPKHSGAVHWISCDRYVTLSNPDAPPAPRPPSWVRTVVCTAAHEGSSACNDQDSKRACPHLAYVFVPQLSQNSEVAYHGLGFGLWCGEFEGGWEWGDAQGLLVVDWAPSVANHEKSVARCLLWRA
jgi:hypothetical protein